MRRFCKIPGVAESPSLKTVQFVVNFSLVNSVLKLENYSLKNKKGTEMKKLAIWILGGIFTLGAINVNAGLQDPNVKHEKQHKATHNKATENKVTKGVGKGAKGAGKGVEHGAYDATHNKATKKTNINKGNQKYSKD